MVAQLRNMASCIGLSGNISILNNFLGYRRAPIPRLSLSQQIRLLRGPHIHLNIIRVGVDQYTNADHNDIESAIQITRDIYSTVNLGVGRIEYHDIDTADANGREDIDNDAEAATLTREWTIPNDALDTFFVLTYTGATAGLSPVRGTCDKDYGNMNGCVIEVRTGLTGQILAHEVGHYLGLRHENSDNTNIMFPEAPNGGRLTADQGDTMRAHCFGRQGCQG